MTSLPSEMARAAVPEQPEALLPPHVRVRIGILGALFLVLHADILLRLGRIAWSDGDWSHAFLIPVISLYFIFQHRDRLGATAPRPCWWGLVLMLVGLAGYLLGLYPLRNDMVKGYSMIVELFGLVLLMVGPAMMRWLWFPIVYLAFAVKVSYHLWESVAWRLQLLAAEGAVFLMTLFGIESDVVGTRIELYEGIERIGALNVAEACSGMRMLMTFIALGVAMAYLGERPWWARGVMALMALPIAIAVNVGRVTILGVLYLFDPRYTAGDFHLLIGMLMLIPALGLFLLLGWVLGLFVDEPPRTAPAAGEGTMR